MLIRSQRSFIRTRNESETLIKRCNMISLYLTGTVIVKIRTFDGLRFYVIPEVGCIEW